MGDIGRGLERIATDPQPIDPPTPLDQLEERLADFFDWAHGRPDPEIRDRFATDFGGDALHDDVVAAIGDGRGPEVRDRLSFGTPTAS